MRSAAAVFLSMPEPAGKDEKMKKYTMEFSVGIFVLLGLICVGYLTVKLGKMELFSNKGYSISARFTSITGLKVGASVDLAGVPVGKVTGISLEPDNLAGLPKGYDGPYNYRAKITLLINDGVRLNDDAIASIKTSGLIGDKYVSLSLGGSETLLAQGDEITDTEPAVDIEGLISKYVFGDVK